MSLSIPLGTPDREYEVVVVLEPKRSSDVKVERGWPPGYFENTYGSVNDNTFIRHPQGELPKPVEFG